MKGYKERVISMVTEEHTWGVGDGPIAQHTVSLQLTSEERSELFSQKATPTMHLPMNTYYMYCRKICLGDTVSYAVFTFFFQTGCSHLLIKIEKVLEKKSQIMVFYVHSPDRALNTWLPFSK